jgi:hypothetical protein
MLEMVTCDFHQVRGGGDQSRWGLCNTLEGKTWGTSEGFANESVQFCDAISDWWPEDWSKPVGYHVTLPCTGPDAAYRTFDSAFVMSADWTNSTETYRVVMRYTHSSLHNSTGASSEYGMSGFCRRGAYGMQRSVFRQFLLC